MSKGVRAVQNPFMDELKASGAVDPDMWQDNRDELMPTPEADYPQLSSLNRVIDAASEGRERQPCLYAVRMTFIYQ